MTLTWTIAVYSGSLANGFTNWDDPFNITHNSAIRGLSWATIKAVFTSTYVDMYVPATMMTYAFDYARAGYDAHAYHATNLLLHLANVAVVFWLVWQLARRAVAAAVVALLFGVHPMNVDSAAWLSARSTLLCSFFYLVSLTTYLRYVDSARRARHEYLLSLAAFVAAALSKAAAISLPLVLFAVDRARDRPIRWATIREKLPYFAVSLLTGAVALLWRNRSATLEALSLSGFDYGVISAYSVGWYLGKLLLPLDLSAFVPYPAKSGGWFPFSYYFVAVLATAVVGLALYTRRSWFREEPETRNGVLFGVLLLALPNAMVIIKVMPVVKEMVANRYAYVPSVGLFIAGVYAARGLDRRWLHERPWLRRLALALVGVYAVALSSAAHRRIAVWHDSISLWDDAIAKDPTSAEAYANRADARLGQFDYAAAVADFDAAIRLNDRYLSAIGNRGYLRYVFLHDARGARDDFDRVLALRPDDAKAYYYRGSIEGDLGELGPAVADFDKAIALDPHAPLAYYGRALARVRLQDLAGACADFAVAHERGAPDAAAQMQRHCN